MRVDAGNVRQVKERLVRWLTERVRAAGAHGVVLGVSGGIDSAVMAGLAKEAFPDHSLGVIMPCDSEPQDVSDALAVVQSVGLRAITVDLSEVWAGLVDESDRALQNDGASGEHQLASQLRAGEKSRPGEKAHFSAANVKPRLRMTTLYYLASLYGYLVVGSENHVELSIGYFTKYGDGGADLFPLGCLVKSEVRALGQELGIPRSIIEKAPTAGLWAGQTDEAELGLGYDPLDTYLLTGEATPALKEKIDGMIARSAHKREFPPIPDRAWLLH